MKAKFPDESVTVTATVFPSLSRSVIVTPAMGVLPVPLWLMSSRTVPEIEPKAVGADVGFGVGFAVGVDVGSGVGFRVG
jgi:hypothetical protein